jgi:putative ABC transport system permease protein
MLSAYFKIAWRNLLKNKAYSAIHIAGLSIGIGVALMIGLWVGDEVAFDSYHLHHARLAQAWVTQTFDGETSTDMTVAMPLGDALRTRYGADFKSIALATSAGEHILAVGEKKILNTGIWAEPDFPVMFSLKMKRGDTGALKDPSLILLGESMARALFGDKDPVGKRLRLDNKLEVQVAGVYEDIPRSSTFYGTGFVLPWVLYVSSEGLQHQQGDWNDHMCLLFVELADHVDAEEETVKVRDITQAHVTGYKEEVLLHPMDKWHLYSRFEDGRVVGGRIQFVWLFGIIGAFVLLLACINFMNLSTARSEKRAREVGVRKAIGSLRSQLIWQFLIESVLTAIFSFFLAVGLVVLFLPFFNSLADKSMSIPWGYPLFWLATTGFVLLTGVVAGTYPAFYLSGFDPIRVLKGTLRMGSSESLPRKVLVVVQFSVSVALIIGTIIVLRQIDFAKSRPVGYDRDGLVTVKMNTDETFGHYNALRKELIGTGAVEEMAGSNSPVTHIFNNNTAFTWKGKDPNAQPLFRTIRVTHDFGRTVGWKVIKGRDFSRDFVTDSSAVILNEAAVEVTGLKAPLGEIINFNGQPHMITGVVKNMLTQSPYESMQPTIYFLDYRNPRYITIKMKSSVPVDQMLSQIEPVFRRYAPGSPFAYEFVNTEYARKFFDEQRIGDLAAVFAGLAIFISCLGLLGLASFIAERRTKEIGIRKVLGASTLSLWGLLSRDFIKLVFISCLIAVPVSWYFLWGWLQHYEYRTPISWWIFLLASLGALLLTLLTISFQAIKAALVNPSRSLRSD